jgi:hypothetical protein
MKTRTLSKNRQFPARTQTRYIINRNHMCSVPPYQTLLRAAHTHYNLHHLIITETDLVRIMFSHNDLRAVL